ncbi:MAG: hypothetical protein RID07_12530, partial [Lacipirellulaceae bacterium]
MGRNTGGGLPRSQPTEGYFTRFDLDHIFSTRNALCSVDEPITNLTQGTTTLAGARDGRTLG